jgi:hypothetical protein
MLGALLLFQAAAAIALSDAPRQEVPAASADLSEVAARVHLNKKALEGWVPKKGVPAPLVDWTTVAPAPVVEPPARRELEPPPEAAIPETVNGFDQPRPWFYAPYPAYGPAFGRRSTRRHTASRTFAGRAATPFRRRLR